MKKIIAIISTLLLCSAFGAVRASAQGASFQSGYFLDNYVYGYRLNPAIMSEKSFFGLGLGNIDAGLSSDIGVSSFLFPNESGTGLVTGLNSSVSKEQFLAGIKDANNIGLDFGLNLLSLGVRHEKSLFTLELNLRADANFALPGSFFRFLKCGSSEQQYDLTDLYVGAKSYTEIALGYSKKFADDKLTVGGRVKALVGLANANLFLDQAYIESNSEKIAANIEGGARAAFAPLSMDIDSEGKTVYNFDWGNTKPAGFGAALDLGVKWEPISGLSVTAGINDLGAISWTYNNIAKAQGGAEFSGFSDVDADTNFEEELKKMGDSIMELANLTPIVGGETALERLSFTANAGVRYRLPVVSFISVGALANYRFDTISPWGDVRLGATLTPLKTLSLSGNVGYGTGGAVCGGAVSLSLLFLNLYVGFDGYCGKLGTYQLDGVNVPVYGAIPFPVDPFRYKLNFGLTMQFGHRRR